MKKSLDFKSAFRYPFNRTKGLINFLWILVPIYGWFALGGYSIRIIHEFLKNKFKELPKMHAWEDFQFGFIMFIKSIPFFMAYFLILGLGSFGIEVILPSLGNVISFFVGLFIIPILTINFYKKQTVSSYFELEKIKFVFNNFSDYLVALLKSICLSIIFLIMIIVLVGLPAGQFTKNIFLADFYRRNVKEK